MRVLFASTHAHLPQARGGLHSTTHELCTAIAELGAQAAVLCAQARADAHQAIEYDESLGYLTARARSVPQALGEVAHHWGADVVVVQSGPAWGPLLAASLEAGWPTAVYLHNVEVDQVQGTLTPDPRVLFLANSGFTAQRWASLASIQCVVVPPVVRGQAYLAEAGGGAGDAVLFVNPVQIKGCEIAFGLAAHCPQFQFIFLESWHMAPEWRRYVRERAAALGNVRCLDATDDMRPVYAQARMLLMPSVWEESFGRTAIEAQLNGLPVLASNRGALPVVVGEGGLTLDPQAPLAHWISALHEMHARPQRWAAAARQRALGHVAGTPLIVADLMQALALHASDKVRPAQPKARRPAAPVAAAHEPPWRAAERQAEQEAAAAPDAPQAWQALGEVRLRQHRWSEAQWANGQALARAPKDSVLWRQAARVQMQLGRPAQALKALEKAHRCEPAQLDIAIEMAQALQRGGNNEQALAFIGQVLLHRPHDLLARELRIQFLTEGGLANEGDLEAAYAELLALLRDQPDQPRGLIQALRLMGLGHDAADEAFAAAAPQKAEDALRWVCTMAVHLHAYPYARRMAAIAMRMQPGNSWLECAAMLLESMDSASTLPRLAQRARKWARRMKASAPPQSPQRPAPKAAPQPQGRPRIAYLWSQPTHFALLERVLAAHGQGKVDVFLYTNEPVRDLPANVHVAPLEFGQLAPSCAANGIDMVIDTGGLHPLGSLDPAAGQYGVLQALAQRIAPVQAAWLGTWGTMGGLVDVLLTDRVSVPKEHERHYSEKVVTLEGGLWCWSPPLYAPAVSPLPASRTGRLTLGVIARPVRMSDEWLRTLAEVTRRLDANLCLAGAVSDDFPSCRRVLAAMAAHGIDASRVRFEPRCSHTAFLAWFSGIDLVLDTFPGSGGLSLLDALWMGVPVVTLAGGWAGARQGASIVTQIGRPQWVARDVGAFVAIAEELGRELLALVRERERLRVLVKQSPLLEGTRLARQIEAVAKVMRSR